MFVGITALAADRQGAHRRPTEHLRPDRRSVDCETRPAAHGDRAGRPRRCSAAPHSIGFFYIQAATALILVLAANTAFNGFPLLGSILAQDKNLPRQLHTRGDRLAYSNGIIMLAVVAGCLICDLQGRRHPADPALHHRRVHLVHPRPDRHGPALEPDCCAPSAIRASGAGSSARGRSTPSARSLTGLVLVIVIVTKFTQGAYLVLIAMPILYVVMRAINRHYTRVAEELASRRASG